MGQKHWLSGESHISFDATGSLTLIYVEDSLLRLAAKLVAEEQAPGAIVIAHVACEAAVTRCISKALAARGAENWAEPVLGVMTGHSLVGTANRTLFEAFLDDDITEQPFWKMYRQSATWRNQIVHNGRVYGRAEAEECVEAAVAFVAHVHQRAGIVSDAPQPT
jgi:hypothetical protein